MIFIDVQLFGAFRKYIPSGEIQVAISSACSVDEFKGHVAKKLEELSCGFTDTNLIFDSALANDDEVLSGDAVIRPGDKLALLPPVCGG